MLKEICGTETDYGWVYDNFEDFAKDHPDTAKEMLTHIAKGDWQDMEIHYYANTYDFADYQISNGVYRDLLDKDLCLMDYHGLASLYDWLDLSGLGKDLAKRNTGIWFLTSDDGVIETENGWKVKEE